MMTFSFNPLRRSSLPSMAALVNTRIVCMNDAAERKLSVVNATFVMPIANCTAFANGLPSLFADSGEYLPDNNLNVLIVYRGSLEGIKLLNLKNNIILHGFSSGNAQEFFNINRAFRDLHSRLDLVSDIYQNRFPKRNDIFGEFPFFLVFIFVNRHMYKLVPGSWHSVFGNIGYLSVNIGNHGLHFRQTHFKNLFHSRQTHRDVRRSRDSSDVECSHCELGSWFTNGLRGDNSNRLTQFDRSI